MSEDWKSDWESWDLLELYNYTTKQSILECFMFINRIKILTQQRPWYTFGNLKKNKLNFENISWKLYSGSEIIHLLLIAK